MLPIETFIVFSFDLLIFTEFMFELFSLSRRKHVSKVWPGLEQNVQILVLLVGLTDVTDVVDAETDWLLPELTTETITTVTYVMPVPFTKFTVRIIAIIQRKFKTLIRRLI